MPLELTEPAQPRRTRRAAVGAGSLVAAASVAGAVALSTHGPHGQAAVGDLKLYGNSVQSSVSTSTSKPGSSSAAASGGVETSTPSGTSTAQATAVPTPPAGTTDSAATAPSSTTTTRTPSASSTSSSGGMSTNAHTGIGGYLLSPTGAIEVDPTFSLRATGESGAITLTMQGAGTQHLMVGADGALTASGRPTSVSITVTSPQGESVTLSGDGSSSWLTCSLKGSTPVNWNSAQTIFTLDPDGTQAPLTSGTYSVRVSAQFCSASSGGSQVVRQTTVTVP